MSPILIAEVSTVKKMNEISETMSLSLRTMSATCSAMRTNCGSDVVDIVVMFGCSGGMWTDVRAMGTRVFPK